MFFFNERIIIPLEMRREIFMKLHENQLGMPKAKSRASQCWNRYYNMNSHWGLGKIFVIDVDNHSIKLTTTPPTYSQSNGQVERYRRNVEIIKTSLRKAHENGQDGNIALLEFWNTPLTGRDYPPPPIK
ncbi:hypothetical protein MAR_027497 [Mya arenaria]|uniref:Integrase catalytic domain-containing protein n=1 Tax=Mya arenaria TaxID=6604 RepID=A0ABY7EWP7_MYAAR|nr:hypothetical protein MAR_027497 [Mya arenaria]